MSLVSVLNDRNVRPSSLRKFKTESFQHELMLVLHDFVGTIFFRSQLEELFNRVKCDILVYRASGPSESEIKYQPLKQVPYVSKGA